MNYPDKQRTTEEYIEAIRKTGGIKTAVAKMLGVSWSAVHKKIQRNKKLQKIMVEVDETILDVAETGLVRAIQKEERWAIELILKTKGKKRGYVEQQMIIPDTQPRPMILVDARSVIVQGNNGDEPHKVKPITLQKALSDGNGSGNKHANA